MDEASKGNPGLAGGGGILYNHENNIFLPFLWYSDYHCYKGYDNMKQFAPL